MVAAFRPRPHTVALFGITAIFSTWPCIAMSQCPDSHATCEANSYVISGSSFGTECPAPDGQGGAVGFHIPTGTAYATALGPPQQCGTVVLNVNDIYHLVGAQAGVPVPFALEVAVHAQATLGVVVPTAVFEVGVYFGLGAPLVFDWTVHASDTRDQVATLPLVKTGDESLPLTVYLYSDACNGTADLEVTWRFVDLPEGVGVESCHGYVQTPPVPVVRRTWSAVRAQYRP